MNQMPISPAMLAAIQKALPVESAEAASPPPALDSLLLPPPSRPPMMSPSMPAGNRAASEPPRNNPLELMAPLFALGAALTGNAHGGQRFLSSFQHQQAINADLADRARLRQRQDDQEARLQDAEVRRVAALEQQAQQEAEEREQRRRESAAKILTEVRSKARDFSSRDDYDAYVRWIETSVAPLVGLRPGAVQAAAPWVPPPVRDRARAQLDVLRKRNDGKVPAGAVDFDIDGDGKPERVPIERLEEYAGEAVFNAVTGARVSSAPAGVQTYGELFTDLRGTPLADKPLPQDAKGRPDYAEATLVRNRMLSGSRGGASAADGRRARTEAVTRLRDDLYAVMLQPGGDPNTLVDQFRKLGLSYRKELADVRQKLYTAGSRLMSPEELAGLEPAEAAEMAIAKARAAFGGGAAVSEPAPAPSGRGARPATTPATGGRGGAPRLPRRDPIAVTQEEIHGEARRLIAEARRAGGDARPVTDADVSTFLNNPKNDRALRMRLAGGR